VESDSKKVEYFGRRSGDGKNGEGEGDLISGLSHYSWRLHCNLENVHKRNVSSALWV